MTLQRASLIFENLLSVRDTWLWRREFRKTNENGGNFGQSPAKSDSHKLSFYLYYYHMPESTQEDSGRPNNCRAIYS